MSLISVIQFIIHKRVSYSIPFPTVDFSLKKKNLFVAADGEFRIRFTHFSIPTWAVIEQRERSDMHCQTLCRQLKRRRSFSGGKRVTTNSCAVDPRSFLSETKLHAGHFPQVQEHLLVLQLLRSQHDSPQSIGDEWKYFLIHPSPLNFQAFLSHLAPPHTADTEGWWEWYLSNP